MRDATFPAVVARAGPDTVDVAVETWTDDDLDPGTVVVAVEWSAVNFKDAMVAQPGNRVARRPVLVPGVDLAGTVLESADPDLPAGTSVLAHGHDLGVAHHGGFAARARLPRDWVLALPAGLDTRQAMVIGTAGFTAALSVDELERRGLRPGDGPVLVTGASGGVGSQALDMLAGRGYEVVASSGKTAEHAWLAHLGAARVIGRDELDEAPGRTLAPERFAGAVDCVGGPTLARVLRALRYGAAVAASGLTGGSGLDTTVYPFIVRAVALLGIDSVATPADRRRAIWDRLAGELRPPHLDDLVEREVGLAEVPEALAAISAARVRGRVLVRPEA